MRGTEPAGQDERIALAARVRALLGGGAVEQEPFEQEPFGQEPFGQEPFERPGGPAHPAPRGAWVPGADEATVRLPEGAHVAAHRRARAPSRVRWNPGHRGALALGCAVVAVLLLTTWWLIRAQPRELPVPASGPEPPLTAPAGGSGAVASELPSPPLTAPAAVPPSPRPAGAGAATLAVPAAGAGASPSGAAGGHPTVVVDVAGRVRRPGVYALPSGARVVDALRAAGGARPGVRMPTLNLAALLYDGQQVLVGLPPASGAPPGPAPPAAAPAAGAPPGSASAPIAPVDLNTATLAQLDTLPGVGPVLAQHVLDWRGRHGRFSTIEQLQDVSGIGPAKFASLKDLVTV